MSSRLWPSLLALLASACAHSPAMRMEAMGQAPSSPVSNTADGAGGDMFDVRARLDIEVEAVDAATHQLREAILKHAGAITGDNVTLQGGSYVGSFDLRLPPGQVDGFLEEVAGLGRVLTRHVTATDVSKEYADSGILLRNLQATLHRYEELLAKANDVKDMLAIEAELGRVRTQIERVEGERRYTEDRTSRATVHVELRQRQLETSMGVVSHEAKFYPGARLTQFAGLGSTGHSYFGGGISLMAGNRLTLDVDSLRVTGTGSFFQGSDLFLVTAGVDTYSEFLGGGRRHFLNPYVGVRLGYARWFDANAFVIAVTVGVELMRFKYVIVDAQVQGVGLLGPASGPGLGVQSALSAHVAF
jgi:hypothetical protein